MSRMLTRYDHFICGCAIKATCPIHAAPSESTAGRQGMVWRCPSCGPGAADEDGCCVTCGADCEAVPGTVSVAESTAGQPPEGVSESDLKEAECFREYLSEDRSIPYREWRKRGIVEAMNERAAGRRRGTTPLPAENLHDRIAGNPAGRLAQGPSEEDFEKVENFITSFALGASFRRVLGAAKEAERRVQLAGELQQASYRAYERLRDLLRDLREELDQEADVDDGTPNLAARLLGMIDGAAK